MVVLNPGELYFGNDADEIATLLGSCVAAVLWHPHYKYAGMCHVVLPEANKGMKNGRYANSAIETLYHDVRRVNTKPEEYQVEVFGGGNMFPDLNNKSNNTVGDKNISAVKTELAKYGFRIARSDVGGLKARKIRLFRKSGKVINVYVSNAAIDEL